MLATKGWSESDAVVLVLQRTMRSAFSARGNCARRWVVV
jgi:hypothetical protein